MVYVPTIDPSIVLFSEEEELKAFLHLATSLEISYVQLIVSGIGMKCVAIIVILQFCNVLSHQALAL